MKWLTQEYIQAQAKKGRRPALECSIEHWEQLAGATYRELVAGFGEGWVDDETEGCALCERYLVGDLKHSSCPLNHCNDGSQHSNTMRVGFSDRYNSAKYCREDVYPAYHREAKKMLKVLKEVHKKLCGKGKK